MPRSIRTINSIATASLSGIYSQNITWSLTLLAAVLILWGEYIFPFNLGENFKSTLDTSTSAIFMCGSLISIWNAVFSVKQDLTSKTIWTILTKPVSRLEYLLGKALGAWLATFATYLFLTPLLLVSAWIQFCYQRLSVTIGYNCLIVYTVTFILVLAIAFSIQALAKVKMSQDNDIILFIKRYKWIAASILGAVACGYLAPLNLFQWGDSFSPKTAAAIQQTPFEWRILPTLVALLELHLLTIVIGITAAMMGSLPMALIGTLLVGFATELVPALWIPHLGPWLPFPAADGLRLSEPLTEVLAMQQPLSTYWLALASQSLPWLAFCGGLLMFARYYLGQHDLADS